MDDKLDLKSLDIKQDKIEQLKKAFPEVVTEGRVDFEKLKVEFGEEVEAGKERYETKWPGKANLQRIIQEPSIGTLKPIKDASVNFETTENLFIEGDSLEVLKLLQKSYYGKVKMIYIDPPYNTGNDFIYPDNYTETLDTYLRYTGQRGEEGLKLTTNSETEGRYHSKWMNMIYPRLFLARNLLKEDGVIFISIDDHEVDNLKKICNEIFGEENFIGQFVVNSTPNARDYGHIGKMHEYVLFYGKDVLSTSTELLPDEDRHFRFEDSRGPFNIHPLYNSNAAFSSQNRPNLYYPFYLDPQKTDKDGFLEISLIKNDRLVEIYPPMSETGVTQFVWRWGKVKSEENLNVEIVGYRNEDGEYRIVQKMRHSAKLIRSLLLNKEFSSRRGTAEVEGIFGSKIFTFPKPLKLIRDFVQIASKSDDIILDFFAGSATTAHAVLDLNKEDDGKRKFIMVQLQELTPEDSSAFKEGYKNIAEIGEERIRRVMNKIKGEIEGELEFENKKIDLGFKVFRLDESNFKLWDKKSDAPLQQQLELTVDNINDKSSDEEILYEIILKSGFELSVPVERIEIQGKAVYSVDNKSLLVCLENDLSQDLMKEISEMEPARVVCLDRGFSNNDQLKTNTVELMKAKSVEFKTV